MPLKKKLLVSGILSLGLWYVLLRLHFKNVCVRSAHTFCSICAMNIARVILEAYQDVDDFTYSFVNAGLFAQLEVAIGTVVACMPTYGPLVIRGRIEKTSKYTPPRSRSYFSGRNTKTKPMTNESFYVNEFERIEEDTIGLRLQPLEGNVGTSDVWVERDGPSVKINTGDGINVKRDLYVSRSGVKAGNDL
jgi:hypothetical protein